MCSSLRICYGTSQHFSADGASNPRADLHDKHAEHKENDNIFVLRKQDLNIPAMRKSAVTLPGKDCDVILEGKIKCMSKKSSRK